MDSLVSGLTQVRQAIAQMQAIEAAFLSTLAEVTAAQARQVRGQDYRDLAWREAAAEVATALHVSDRTAQARLGEASMVVTDFPGTYRAWAAGELDQSRVRVIMDAGMSLSGPEARAEYEGRVLGRAGELTPGRLKPVCRAAAAAVDPAVKRERQVRARVRRGVSVSDLDDGMAQLRWDASAVLVHAAFDRLTQMARAVQDAAAESPGGDRDADAAAGAAGAPGAPGAAGGSVDDGAGVDVGVGAAVSVPVEDGRTLDQTRADVLSDLLLTGAPTGHGPADALEGIRAHVQVNVPVHVLEPGRSHRIGGPEVSAATEIGGGVGAELVGHGPIDDEMARVLAGAAKGWDRIFTDPVTGAVNSVDRYRPSEHLRRLLRVRDEHCRFPGCRQPTWRCDIDHTHDAARGGMTSEGNLAHLCRRHHVVKHQTRWRVRQLPGGVLEWTSPTGRVHVDQPSPGVRFACARPPAATVGEPAPF